MHTAFWTDLLVPGIPVIEKIVRPIIIYLVLVAALRLSCKRELAQLNPFDLIVLLTLSNTVQNAIIGNDNSVVGGLVGAAALLALNYLVVRLVRHRKSLQRLLEGRADVLVRDGRILKDHLNRELITREDRVAQRRRVLRAGADRHHLVYRETAHPRDDPARRSDGGINLTFALRPSDRGGRAENADFTPEVCTTKPARMRTPGPSRRCGSAAGVVAAGSIPASPG